MAHVDVAEPCTAVDDRLAFSRLQSDALPSQDEAGSLLLVGPELGNGVEDVFAVEIFEKGVL
jgi:hypothetical protein